MHPKGTQGTPRNNPPKLQKATKCDACRADCVAKKCHQRVPKWLSNGPQGAAKTPQRTPQGSPRAPKAPQRHRSEPQGLPKKLPNATKCDACRADWGAEKCHQSAPRWCPRGAKKLQREPKVAHKGRQGAAKAPQGPPRDPQRLPKVVQNGARAPQREPRGNEESKMHGARARSLPRKENCNKHTRKRQSRIRIFMEKLPNATPVEQIRVPKNLS
jgi:hypothetical protein